MRTPGRGNRKKSTGFGWLALLMFVFFFYLMANEDRNEIQTPAPPTVAIHRTATPAPTGFVFFIPTRPPGFATASGTQPSLLAAEITRLAQQYPEADLKAALSAVEGVSTVTTARVTVGPSVYAEIMVEAGRNGISTADRLRLALLPVLKEADAEYVFMLDDGQQASEYTYRDGIWTAMPL